MMSKQRKVHYSKHTYTHTYHQQISIWVVRCYPSGSSDLPWTVLLTQARYSGPVFMFLAEWSKSGIYVGQQKQGHRQLQRWWHFNQNPHGIQRGLGAWLHFSESTICTRSLVNKSLMCTVHWMGNGSMSDSACSPSAHRAAWWPWMTRAQRVRKAEWDQEQGFVVNTDVCMKERRWVCGTESCPREKGLGPGPAGRAF